MATFYSSLAHLLDIAMLIIVGVYDFWALLSCDLLLAGRHAAISTVFHEQIFRHWSQTCSLPDIVEYSICP